MSPTEAARLAAALTSRFRNDVRTLVAVCEALTEVGLGRWRVEGLYVLQGSTTTAGSVWVINAGSTVATGARVI